MNSKIHEDLKNVSIVRPFTSPACSAFMFDAAEISLPDGWLSAWSEFGVWLLEDPVFGVAKFAAGCHRRLIEEIVATAKSQAGSYEGWSALAVRSCIASVTASSLEIDVECAGAIATAYAFAMSMRTGNPAWALRACAASAFARASGWSAYARGYSANKVYERIHAQTLAAQEVELSRLLAPANKAEPETISAEAHLALSCRAA